MAGFCICDFALFRGMTAAIPRPPHLYISALVTRFIVTVCAGPSGRNACAPAALWGAEWVRSPLTPLFLLCLPGLPPALGWRVQVGTHVCGSVSCLGVAAARPQLPHLCSISALVTAFSCTVHWPLRPGYGFCPAGPYGCRVCARPPDTFPAAVAARAVALGAASVAPALSFSLAQPPLLSPTRPPSDVSVCGSLRRVCVLSEGCFVELQLSNLL